MTDPATEVEVDEGRFIRVFAEYDDGFGEDDDATGVSMRAVRAEEPSQSDGVENPENGSPGFTEGLDYTRSVDEGASYGTDIGAAVSAMDPDSDELSYDLWVDHDRDADDDADVSDCIATATTTDTVTV